MAVLGNTEVVKLDNKDDMHKIGNIPSQIISQRCFVQSKVLRQFTENFAKFVPVPSRHDGSNPGSDVSHTNKIQIQWIN